MLRFRRPIQSLITSSRYFIFMSSYEHGSQGSCRQRCQDGNGICLCRKSTFTRAASSCCTDNGHGKATEDSQDYRSRERQVLQWDKLSEDEKNIYFAHKHACMNEKNSYIDPVTGYMVFTEEFLKKRSACCGNGCRHCPYGHENVPEGRRKKFNSAFFV